MSANRIPTLPADYYHAVIEESYRPVAAAVTYATVTGPNAKTHSTPCVPEGFVEILRAQGIKVRARHYRWVVAKGMATEPVLSRISKHDRKALAADFDKPYPPTILQNGGETHVAVTMPDGREAEGEAICSDKDLYDKRLGVYLATKRALALLKRQIAE